MKNTIWNKAKHQKITPCLSCKVWQHKTLFLRMYFFWPTNPTLKDLFTSLLASQKARLSLDRSLCSGQQEKSNGLDGSEDMVQVKAVIKRILPHHQTCSLFSSNQVYYLQLSRLLCKSNSGSKNGGNYLYLIKIYENNVHGAVKKQ